MSLNFEKEGEDSRGKYVWCKKGDSKISIFEIKKGYIQWMPGLVDV